MGYKKGIDDGLPVLTAIALSLPVAVAIRQSGGRNGGNLIDYRASANRIGAGFILKKW